MPTTHEITATHVGGMAFKSLQGKHTLVMDAQPEFGGEDLGFSPKKLLLQGLAGCTGIDVVSMLEKMRVSFSDFTIAVSAQVTEEHPKIYNQITITYSIRVAQNQQEKMKKAVTLSKERYCGVSAMLGAAAKIDFKIVFLAA